MFLCNKYIDGPSVSKLTHKDKHSNLSTYIRDVINGKAGKVAALHKFSDMLSLSQPGGADYAHPLALLG